MWEFEDWVGGCSIVCKSSCWRHFWCDVWFCFVYTTPISETWTKHKRLLNGNSQDKRKVTVKSHEVASCTDRPSTCSIYGVWWGGNGVSRDWGHTNIRVIEYTTKKDIVHEATRELGQGLGAVFLSRCKPVLTCRLAHRKAPNPSNNSFVGRKRDRSQEQDGFQSGTATNEKRVVGVMACCDSDLITLVGR